MEEILASIRRIIETNEPQSDGSFASQPAYEEEDEIELADEPAYVPAVAANDRGQPSLQPQPSVNYVEEEPAPVQATERTMSLADVAARVRAASMRQQEQASGRASAPAPAPVEPARAARSFDHVELRASIPPVQRQPAAEQGGYEQRRFEPAAEQPSRQEPRFEAPVREIPVREVQPVEQRLVEPRFAEPAQQSPVQQPPVQPSPVQVAPAPAAHVEMRQPELKPVEPEATSLPAKIEETARLLSLEAGEQVAQSFNDLAAVFNGLERRSVEDMAQELLRPMLQEWLDDNLPTLVERLVREEIERVARGPRR
jgi:cell pole-organizing protein PopZ